MNSEVGRFWEKVKKADSCWEWTAAKNSKGYGSIKIGGKTVSAHRYSWQLKNGKIPEGMSVCHTCDNTSCVRPDHLFLGTQADNMQDMSAKGRSVDNRGENSALSKLTENQVSQIRHLYPKNTQQEIADEFGISRSHVGNIVNNKFWSIDEKQYSS